MTTREHDSPPPIDALPLEALSNTPMLPEYTYTTSASSPGTNQAYECDAQGVPPTHHSVRI